MQSSSKTPLSWLALAGVLLALAGCAREAEENIGGGPINADDIGSADSLDPDDEANQAGYLYDEFVVGARYTCFTEAGSSFSGHTRENGMFVCPARSSVVFGLGRASEIIIGSIDFKSYVGSSRPVITPVALAGANADEYTAKAINIATLLRALDADMDPNNRFINISSGIHRYITEEQVDLDVSTDLISFSDALNRFLNRLRHVVVLTHAGAQESPAAATARLRGVLARTAAGIYITYAPMLGNNAKPTYDPAYVQAGGEMVFLRSRSGAIRGRGQFQYAGSGTNPSSLQWKLITLDAGASIDGRGRLVDFLTDPVSDVDVEFSGRFINDVTYGDKDLLKEGTGQSALLPTSYRYAPGDVAGWRDDANEMKGELNLTRIASVSPDLELENAVGMFPVHMTLETVTYPLGRGTPKEKRGVTTYPTGADFDPPLPAAPVETLRITLLESGDVVTDVDGDCSAVDADLVDGDGDQEFLVGLVGSVRLEDDGAPRASLLIQDHNPASPGFGFQMGFQTSAAGNSLGQVRVNLQTRNLELLADCAGGGHVCPESVQWFNDHVYYSLLRDVWAALGDDDVFDAEDLYVPGHFGRLVSAGATTCP